MDGGHDDQVIIELPLGKYVPVFRPNAGRQRVRTRMYMLRGRIVRGTRQYAGLVILIAVIATTISLGLDFFWRALDARSRPPNNVLLAAPPAATPGTTGSFKR